MRRIEVLAALGVPLCGLLALAALLPASARAGEAEFMDLVQDVRSASGYRYSARDDRGDSMDTLKIVTNPAGGYVGVYHITVAGRRHVRVGTSTDLLHWKARTVLANDGSQPTIARLAGGTFLVAYEQEVGCVGAGAPATNPNGRCLRFLHYPSLTALLTRRADASFQTKRTMSGCAEGTPNIYAAHLNPDLAHSRIRVGFHYQRRCQFDRQAIGTLTNFSHWAAEAPSLPNGTIQALGAQGHIGDRDSIWFDSVQYRLIEGQLALNDFSSWRTFLYSQDFGAKLLDLRTHRGSTAFANPTATRVVAPGGGEAIVITQYIPASGAAPGEAGELIYYKRIPSTDPVIAAVGDIACDPTSPSFNAGLGTAGACRQKYTADLVASMPAVGVLPLGDIQYENGAFSKFMSSYDLSWGRFKHITYPAIGNHEMGTSAGAGYYDYFNGVGVLDGPAGERGKGYYSYDIGAWHIVALNSNCTAASSCRAGQPQETCLRADLAAHPNACTLAYWHHPRFSSGQHGDTPLMQDIWKALYDSGADVVLTGHDHLYERFGPQTETGVADPARGIRSFVVGTGGRSHYGFGIPRPNSEVRNSDAFGVLKMTLHANSYDWEFVAEPGEAFTDSGSANCH